MNTTLPEFHWLIGLLEGEGCFGTRKFPNGQILPYISLRMTDKDIVIKAGKLLGGMQQDVRVSQWNPKYKPVYRWGVSGKHAVKVMLEILPYMGSRRSDKIMEVLTVYEKIQAGVKSKGTNKRVRRLHR